MSSKFVLVRLIAGLIATGAGQCAWARLPSAAPAPAPVVGKPVDFQASTRAEDQGENPYAVITSQNVFHLVPAPPPPPPPAAPDPAAQATIKLTGIIQVAGQQPRAMFVSTPKDPKDTAYYNLAEGERQDNLELVKILQDQEAAEVIQAGTRMTIELKNSKPVVASAPARGPGAIPPTPAPVEMASIIGASREQPGGSGVMMGGALPTQTASAGQPGAVDGSIPTRPLRGTSQQPARSLDETHVLMAADAVLHQDEISKGEYPPPLPSIENILNGKDPNAGDGSSRVPSFPGQ